jgi:hypothetical protein
VTEPQSLDPLDLLDQVRGFPQDYRHQTSRCPDPALAGDLPDPAPQLMIRQREATVGTEALTRHDPNIP